jgi:hypothetical protein
MADQDVVVMTHPDLPDMAPVETTEFAFENSWAPRGWQRVENNEGGSGGAKRSRRSTK